MSNDKIIIEPTEQDVLAAEFAPVWSALGRADDPTPAGLLERVKAAAGSELKVPTEAELESGEFAPVWAAMRSALPAAAPVGLADQAKALARTELSSESRVAGDDFAPMWSAMRSLPAENAPAGLVERVKAAVRAQVRAGRRPVVVRGIFRRVAAVAALAAALALAVLVGMRMGSTPTINNVDVAVNPTPSPTPAAVEPDLGAVASVPDTVVEAVANFVDVRAAVESLGKGFDEMNTQTAALSLADEFPFLEKTFEETLGGAGGE